MSTCLHFDDTWMQKLSFGASIFTSTTLPIKIIVSGDSAPAPPLPVTLKASEKSAFRLPQGCASGSLGENMSHYWENKGGGYLELSIFLFKLVLQRIIQGINFPRRFRIYRNCILLLIFGRGNPTFPPPGL